MTEHGLAEGVYPEQPSRFEFVFEQPQYEGTRTNRTRTFIAFSAVQQQEKSKQMSCAFPTAQAFLPSEYGDGCVIRREKISTNPARGH